MKSCARCTHAETSRGMFCPSCDAVLLLMSQIQSGWKVTEIEALRDRLRGDSVAGLLAFAKDKGAIMLLALMKNLSWLSSDQTTPDMLKSKLCDEINVQIKAHADAKAFDEKKGEGAYNRYCCAWIEKEISPVARNLTQRAVA